SIDVATPVGTIVYDWETGEVLHDFTTPGDRFVVARGGRGGKGNARFATSTHQAPTEHEDGSPGEERKLRLELKLLADVALVGFPNAGKSTLISRISAARPKIANYPLTTLTPTLGVVSLSGDRSFVVADVPGLIKGAHEGHGLGQQFLRHIERTKILVHLVDVSSASGRDAVEDFETIRDELRRFDARVAAKRQIVVATKIDALDEPERLDALRRYVRKKGLPFVKISAVTGEGLDELLETVWRGIVAAREAAADAEPETADEGDGLITAAPLRHDASSRRAGSAFAAARSIRFISDISMPPTRLAVRCG